MIQSVAGMLQDGKLTECSGRFEVPHHADLGSGHGGWRDREARPGEVSLAHKGVLFLDELPEFNRSVLEALRQPLESGEHHRGARQPPRHLPRALPAHRRDEPLRIRCTVAII